jgi:hypothetical protein
VSAQNPAYVPSTGDFPAVVGAVFGVLRSWMMAMMCSSRLMRRLPPLDGRWRLYSPPEASRGAVPFPLASVGESCDVTDVTELLVHHLLDLAA